MKKILAIFLFLAVLLYAFPTFAVITTYNCDALIGGGARDLDALSDGDLVDNDRAIVEEDGKIMRFYYDASSTDAENVTTHPYKVRPDDYDTGVWIELAWEYVVRESSVNLLTNSGFGMWSRSEGLYEPSTGALPTTTESLVTTPLFDADPGGWTLGTGWTIAGGVAVVNTAGANAMTESIGSLTIGKIYKITYTISGYATGDIQAYVDAAVGTARGSDATFSHVFEATATTHVVGLVRSSGTADMDIDNFIFTEVTPGIVGANALGPDGWEKVATADIFRQHEHATYTKGGSFYSIKVVPSAAGDYQLKSVLDDLYANEVVLARVAGRTVTFGAWVWTATGTHVRAIIRDGVASNSYSTYHSGGSGWEWLKITMTIDGTPTRPALCSFGAAQTSGVFYVSQPMLVFGSSIGEGNYVQPPGEVVWLEGENALVNYSNVTLGATDDAVINLESESEGKLPKGLVAVYMQFVGVADSITTRALLQDGSSGATFMYLRSQVVAATFAQAGWVGTGGDGDIYINTNIVALTSMTLTPRAVQVSP